MVVSIHTIDELSVAKGARGHGLVADALVGLHAGGVDLGTGPVPDALLAVISLPTSLAEAGARLKKNIFF